MSTPGSAFRGARPVPGRPPSPTVADAVRRTQNAYTSASPRRRMEMVEDDSAWRRRYDPEFAARVQIHSQLAGRTGSRGLDRAVQEIVMHVLHLDDVAMGRWVRPEPEPDPIVR